MATNLEKIIISWRVDHLSSFYFSDSPIPVPIRCQQKNIYTYIILYKLCSFIKLEKKRRKRWRTVMVDKFIKKININK